MKLQHLSLLLSALLLAGCATMADIRDKPPDYTMESRLAPEQIASEVEKRAPVEVTNIAVPYYHFTLSKESNGTFHVLAEIPGQPSGEAIFQPTDTGGTHIELRSRWNFWGEKAFWDCIQHCASPQSS